MSGRIRTIKPEWLEDEALAASGSFARVLSVGLILLADDHGRGRASDQYLAAQVFAYEPGHLDCARESLAKLRAIGFVRTYDIACQRYYEIRNWTKHQRVDKPGKPRVPPPPEDAPPFANNPGSLLPPSRLTTISDHDHDPEKDPDPDRDRERDLRAREEPPEQTDPEPWLVVAKAYQVRWERDTGTLWQAFGLNRSALESIASWVVAQIERIPQPLGGAVDALLDAFWIDDWAKSKQWPLGALAKNPGRYLAIPAVAASAPNPPSSAPVPPELAALDALVQSLLEQIDAAYTAGEMLQASELKSQLDDVADNRRKLAARIKRGAA